MPKRSRLSRNGNKARSNRLRDIKNWVGIGYGSKGEGSRSLEFKTEGLTPSEASKIVTVVPSYNNFVGKDVSDVILKIKGKVSSVSFGREGSPVLYVDMPFWTGQVAGNKGLFIDSRPFTSAEKRSNAEAVMKILRATKPDELDYNANRGQIRAWWD